MRKIDAQVFNQLLDASSIKPRLKRELRFTTSTSHLNDNEWSELEMIRISDRSGNEGVLLLEHATSTYIIPYALKNIGASASTGRPQPIICDFCRTWQSGTRAGTITFTIGKRKKSSVTYLCCEDLRCSDHVRTKTSASKISRAQLREDMNDEDRVDRLKRRLAVLVNDLRANPCLSAHNPR